MFTSSRCLVLHTQPNDDILFCFLIWLRLFLQVGRNIDIAFLVLCAHAMDQMFYDKDYD